MVKGEVVCLMYDVCFALGECNGVLLVYVIQ